MGLSRVYALLHSSVDGTTAEAPVTSTTVDSNTQALDVYVKGGGAGGGAVTVADGADVALGTTSDVAWTSGNGTVIGLLKKLIAQLGGTITVGQGTAANLKVDASGATVPVSGTFWQTTQPVSLASLPALAAGTNLIGETSASNETSTVYNGTTALTPKFATIAASASGATTVVAAVLGKRIRVLAWTLVCNAAVNVKWQSHVTPTDITGLSYFAANGGISVPFSPVGHFQTVSGEALDINLSGAVAVGGSLVYVEV